MTRNGKPSLDSRKESSSIEVADTPKRNLLTPEIVEEICADIELGISMRLACEARGIAPSTFSERCKRDPVTEQQRARARRNLCINLLEDSRNPDAHPQAAMFKLERLFRDDGFGKPVDTQIAVQQNMVNSGNSGPTEEEKARVLRALFQKELAENGDSIPVKVIEEGSK